MIELRLFGAAELRSDSGALEHSFLAGPKRLALLSYLVLARPRGLHRRDTLLPLFWPESSEKSARNSLSNLLYHVRRAMGDGVVETRGAEEVGISEGRVWCDVLSFEDLLEGKRIDEALGLYRGELLTGLHVSGVSAEFGRWLEGERDRLHRMYQMALEDRAEQAEAASDWQEAVRWWRPRAAAEPYSARVALRFVEALERAGARSSALRHAERHIARMVEEIGADADPEIIRAAERLREAPRSARAPTARTGQIPTRSIAVLAFESLSVDAEEYLGEGIAEELIARLAKVPGLRVAARTSSFAFKATGGDARAIGERLGVRMLLEGSVRRAGSKVRVTAQLVSTADGFQIWSETYQREAEDILAVQDEIGRTVAAALEIELAGEGHAALAPDAWIPEAYDLYLRGRHEYNRGTEESLDRAVALFRQSIRRDPRHGQAYAGLADCYLALGSSTHGRVFSGEALGRAEENAETALAMDASLIEAHVSLGLAQMQRWDWSGAETRLRRATELGPGHAAAHHRYGWLLAVTGRYGAALSELAHAEELDPLSLPIQTAVGRVYQFMGDPDRAIAHYRRMLHGAPRFAGAHFALGLALLESGLHAEAVAALEHARELTGDTPSATAILACAYATAGEKTRAKEFLRGLFERRRREHVPACKIAEVHAFLGEHDDAYDWYDRAVEERSPGLMYLKVRPLSRPWAEFRCDPRFEDLLSRVGFAGLGPKSPLPASG